MLSVNYIANYLTKEQNEISNDKYTLYKDAYLEEREFQVLDGNLDDSDLTKDIAD